MYRDIKTPDTKHMTITQKAIVVCVGIILGGFLGHAYYVARTTPRDYLPAARAEKQIEPKPVPVMIEIQPIMLSRIGDCESGERRKDGSALPGSSRQLDTDGKVIIGKYTDPKNGTDIGRYMINSVHERQARDMGLDLWTDEGNGAFARYLYRTEGTAPWNASKSCWNR